MSTDSSAPYRAYRRGGRLVLEIDESHLADDATRDALHRIVDRDAFTAFVCENLFDVIDPTDPGESHPNAWDRLCQNLCAEAAERGAGVIPNDGSAALPIAQPPDLFPDREIRRLLGAHVKDAVEVADCGVGS